MYEVSDSDNATFVLGLTSCLMLIVFVTTLVIANSSPSPTDFNCIRQPCFQRGCTKHME